VRARPEAAMLLLCGRPRRGQAAFCSSCFPASLLFFNLARGGRGQPALLMLPYCSAVCSPGVCAGVGGQDQSALSARHRGKEVQAVS
jgi:hypothetical protein